MALAEVAPFEFEDEAERLHLVQDEQEHETDVPEYMAAKIRTLVMDTTIDLPNSKRSKRENYGTWDESSLEEYGHWLCAILQIDPSDLSVPYIERASKLDLGPARTAIRTVYGKDSVTKLKTALGDTNPLYKFKGKSREWCTVQGIKLADDIGGRPTRYDLKAARAEGILPGEAAIASIFGSLRVFHEKIGRPSFKGATEQDLLDWLLAFKIQNGAEAKVDTDALELLSGRGVAPSTRFVSPFFGNMGQLNARADEEFASYTQEQEEVLAVQQDSIDEMLRTDATFAELHAETKPERQLLISARYQLAKIFLKDASDETIVRYINNGTAPLVSAILEQNPRITRGEVEIVAEELRIFETLWPGYRYQNANLRLDQDVA